MKTIKNKSMLLRTIIVLGMAAILVPVSVAAQQPGVKRNELQRHDLSIAGREAVQVRIDIEPGIAFGNHTHPGEEVIYVLNGELEYKVEGKESVTLKAGDVLFIPAGTIHAARNKSRETASELATYIVAKDKPILTLVRENK